jgi:hypothetical protein
MSNTVLISVRQTTSITRFSPSRLSAALALPTSRSAVKYGLSGLGGRDVRTVIWGRAGGRPTMASSTFNFFTKRMYQSIRTNVVQTEEIRRISSQWSM